MDPKPRLFATRRLWRDWLVRHHSTEKEIWLAYYKKGSGKRSVTYKEALEEALCFGWIDSTVRTLDAERYRQRYTPRNERSIWSRSNKARIEKLIAEGRMAAPGLAKVEAAKRNGSWDTLYDIDRIIKTTDIPPDLLAALDGKPGARAVFDRRPPSEKRMWAYWVVSAKRPETRARRVAETVNRVLAGRRPGM
jgi:uncharacterized protein YdeI (YjbR/CyaY-like superfamily)